MEAEYYVLSQDEYSTFNKGFKYASKGDKVRLISKKEHLVCVEKSDGERFTVAFNNLNEYHEPSNSKNTNAQPAADGQANRVEEKENNKLRPAKRIKSSRGGKEAGKVSLFD